jgi:hypothetical protein
MEKKFAHITLFTATFIVASMIMYPPLRLMAQDELQIDESTRMHRGTVQEVDLEEARLFVAIGEEESVPVTLTASTTILLGNGEEGNVQALGAEMNVYVFGYYSKEDRSIEAEKIVIRNRRITERTTPSRAELEKISQRQMFSRINPLELLGSIGR